MDQGFVGKLVVIFRVMLLFGVMHGSASQCRSEAVADIDKWLSDIRQPVIEQDDSQQREFEIDSPVLTNVDIGRLIVQAKRIVERSYPNSLLTNIRARSLRGGRLDLSNSDNWVDIDFYRKQIDSTKPLGQEVQHQRVRVGFRAGEVSLDTLIGSSLDAREIVPLPKCGMQQALEKAVSRGLPVDAAIEVSYGRARFSNDLIVSAGQWEFSVNEHREFDRTISDLACQTDPIITMPKSERVQLFKGPGEKYGVVFRLLRAEKVRIECMQSGYYLVEERSFGRGGFIEQERVLDRPNVPACDSLLPLETRHEN